MKLIFIIILKFLFSEPIQEVDIKDDRVIKALNIYLDSLNTKVPNQKINYQLIARVEKSEQTTIVYVAAITNIGFFWHNMPDKFSRFNGRLVFLYEAKKMNDDNSGYRDFHEMFKNQVLDNCSVDGKFDIKIESMFIDAELIGAYRIVINNQKRESVREVCKFPDKKFYRGSYTFDADGNLMFEDGAYDPCSIDRPHKSAKSGYNPWNYLRMHSDSLELLKNEFGVTITIDTTGHVIQAVVIVEKGVSDDQFRRKLTETILHMPPWNPATVNGKKVRYRFQIGL